MYIFFYLKGHFNNIKGSSVDLLYTFLHSYSRENRIIFKNSIIENINIQKYAPLIVVYSDLE